VNAAFYSPAPRPLLPAPGQAHTVRGRRARRLHRWVAIIFTPSVAANFAAMPWGPPPAWITYAPLPPLLFLVLTGMIMLVRPWILAARGRKAVGSP
jgi:hypothetical protein